MLFGEIVAVHCENHLIKSINTICGQKVFNVKVGNTRRKPCA